MSFIESQCPNDHGFGGSGGPGYNTDIVVTASGYEHRNQNWSSARRAWDIGYTRTQLQLDTLMAFFHAVKGKANGFRFRDSSDFAVTVANGLIGSGVGDGTPGPFQLKKRYTSGSETTDRDIKKPSVIYVYRGGVLKTITTHYTQDTTTGLITLNYDATSNASAITVGATTSVTLAANPGTLIAGQKLYLAGFTGADAALVNDIAHTINSVSGSGPYVFVIATNTAGKTITVGSGSGTKYPQPSETLTWAGEFDCAARFDTDELRAQMLESTSANRMYSVPSVPIVEIRV